MLENEKEIPEVKFTFDKGNQTSEERKKKIESLLKKRNEIYASMGISIPSTTGTETNEMSGDYPRRFR